MSEPNVTDAVIVGAGPAGVAAAVQLARHGFRPVIFERGHVGGLLRTAWFVENHPGFPGGIAGIDLARLLREHLGASGAELIREEVTAVDRVDGLFSVKSRAREVRARAVIVASGTVPIKATGIDLPADLANRVFREVHELWGAEGATIAVVGSGDAAFDYSLGLAETSDVVILVRGGEPKCLPVLEERARASRRIDLRTQTNVRSVRASECGLVLSLERGPSAPGRLSRERPGNVRAGAEELHADYLVLALGREPSDEFLSDTVRRDLVELEIRSELLLAGDVVSGIFRQSSIASGQGVLAAMRVAARLAGEEDA